VKGSGTGINSICGNIYFSHIYHVLVNIYHIWRRMCTNRGVTNCLEGGKLFRRKEIGKNNAILDKNKFEVII
jgi:hypothetical protein